MRRLAGSLVILVWFWPVAVHVRTASGEPAPIEADRPAESEPAVDYTVEKLVEVVRKSVVVITFTGRDGKREGLGTGFVVGADGLIATNLHVIGDARPISVQTADGKRYDATSVHASDRFWDLALLKIDAKNLPALILGDSDALKQGQAVVAVGNPQGLTHSVVAGLVSGQPDVDGRTMIQLAIPIEPGNSGGPLLDMRGRVHGLLTMKSLVTANLGFAVPVNRLKPLLEKPNPVPMARWLTIGTLDPKRWTPVMGARWRQRGGRIAVDGLGAGLGGRSLCLSQASAPEAPYEVAVTVKLDNEAGAAGLVFGSDGGDIHYGFYPSAGGLRLSRFDGPDVTSWQVLRHEQSSHYRPGDWNRLKVRVEAEKVVCYVNDQAVFESTDARPATGRVGLAKFRDTRAEFKGFRLAKELAGDQPAAELRDRVERLTADIPATGPLGAELVQQLAPDASASVHVLRERARLLKQQATQLELLAEVVHARRVLDELEQLLAGPDASLDLIHSALLLAKLDNDELDVDAYRQEIDRMAADLASTIAADAPEADRLAALNDYLFKANGFHGSRSDYYNRANSYINEVLDDREGLPITLSMLYMELGRRIGLSMEGVGLPGRFVVRHQPAQGDAQLIDVYEQGTPLTRDQAADMVRDFSGAELSDESLKAIDKRAILVRMLHNLRGIAGRSENLPAMLRYLDAILLISPDLPEDRMYRAFFRYQAGLLTEALVDVIWLQEHEPQGIDLGRVEELRQLIERPNPQNR